MSRHISDAGRSRMLEKIRRALDTDGTADQRRAGAAARIQKHEVQIRPSRAEKPADELLAMFRGYLEGQSATVLEVATRDAVPQAVAGYLRKNNLPQRLRCGSDAALAQLPWSGEPQLERVTGAASLTDEVGLSRARSGVAETGTLVLTSGEDNPVTVTFVPENHIVMIDAKDIVGTYEEAWSALRKELGGAMPRTVNFVSGPSRTGDIGGKLVMGAHGPRRMCVVIVKS